MVKMEKGGMNEAIARYLPSSIMEMEEKSTTMQERSVGRRRLEAGEAGC